MGDFDEKGKVNIRHDVQCHEPDVISPEQLTAVWTHKHLSTMHDYDIPGRCLRNHSQLLGSCV